MTAKPGLVVPADIAAFFKDADGSSIISLASKQITAPMIQGTAVTLDELSMGGGLRVVYYILDRSPSMADVGPLLLKGFNEDLVPAIKEAREDDISTLRIGGSSFSSDITQIWGRPENGKTIYFHELEKLPLLTSAEYNPSRGWATALHAAIIDGCAKAMAYAGELRKEYGIQPEVDVIVLTDGANNEPPNDLQPVQSVITGSRKDLVRFVFFYFQTKGGLADPEGYARELGFDPENTQVFAKKKSETDKEYKSRFRRMMRVMSRVSASKGTNAVQAASAVPPADAEEDIV
ncbi:MAG: VWA domain-containing protein [Patescibacteria group bacterium]|nr:VWA domain-containing protein [Patescibacteria group bacterium]